MANEQREDNKRVVKEAFKEALKEWLDEKFTDFGKWSLGGIAALILSLIVYMILVTHGWRAPV